MARLIVVPGLLAPEDEPDLLPSLTRIPGFGRARVQRMAFPSAAGEGAMPPEALWLGLEPGEGELAPGPLRVAALGWDPPERSTQFGLDYLSGKVESLALPDSLGTEETETFRTLLGPLLRGPFRLLPGESGHDALVWEQYGRFLTVAPAEVVGQALRESMPDGEAWLHRFVDDSANLFLDTEPNRVRMGEGRLPILCAWPWGSGWRLPVPSLPLRLGRPLTTSGGPEAFRGLSRLVGARKRGDAEIVVLDDAPRWREIGGFEEVDARLSRELAPRLAPLLSDPELAVAIALPDAWSPSRGLWLTFLPNTDGEGEIRREMLEERRVPTLSVPRAIGAFLASD